MIRRIYPNFATGIEVEPEGTTDKHMGIDPPPSGSSLLPASQSPPFKIKSPQASPVRRNRLHRHQCKNLKAFICFLVFHFLRFGE